MSNEKSTFSNDREDMLNDIFDELDAEISDIRATSDGKSDHVSLEQAQKAPVSKQVYSLEMLDEPQTDSAETLPLYEFSIPAEEDVIVFEGSKAASSEVDRAGETRVISTDEIEKEKETLAADTHTRTLDKPVDTEKRKSSAKKSGKKKKKKNEAVGCLKSIIYVVVVLAIACSIAYFAYLGIVDLTGIGRSDKMVSIVVENNASTEEIAQLLVEKDIISQPYVFRAYCRFTHADGTFQPGKHMLAQNFGYTGIVDELQKEEVLSTVTLTIPEGSSVDRIAAILEDNGVCTATDFYTTVVTGDFEDYDFIAELTPEERKDRVYLLEGYLFPDTYEFFENDSPENVVRKMLDDFDTRVNADTRETIKASGKTLNEVLIQASIVQREAGNTEDMPRVARVISNRLNNPDEFPNLQCDSTEDYLTSIVPSVEGIVMIDTAYNTYTRAGLPVGSVCNPGLAAINAVMNPSEEEDIINCYYFASIIKTGASAFFETFEEHEAWCEEHGVGMYG